jgi:hypothetical protein
VVVPANQKSAIPLFTFFHLKIHSKRFDSLLTQTPNGRSIPGGFVSVENGRGR